MSSTTKNKPEARLPTPVTEAPASSPCPRCGKSLIDPTGLGWCAGCGFCKSLTHDGAEEILTDKKTPSLGGVVEAGGAITNLPMWFWASLVVIAAGIVFSIAMDKRLPTGDSLTRATWASVQMAAGLLFMFLAQCAALVSIAPTEPTLSFKDAVAPFRLWPMVCKRLPKLKACLWSALFGVSLIVGGAVFIGGLQHWFSYLPKSVAQQAKDRASQPTGSGETIVMPD